MICVTMALHVTIFAGPVKNETLTSSTPDADTSTPTPYTPKYLALKWGEWEHKQLLASGLILFAMNARMYARYEAYEDPVQLWTILEEDDKIAMEDNGERLRGLLHSLELASEGSADSHVVSAGTGFPSA